MSFAMLCIGLGRVELWKDAACQVFFSLGATSCMISLASYNKINNNCQRQAVIVCFANYLFSIMSGICVYILLHFEDQEDHGKQGAEIAFIFYLKEICGMPEPTVVWATLFFVMFYTLGIDSLFGFVDVFSSAIIDNHRWLSTRRFKPMVYTGTCLAGFLLGLSMCTGRGKEIFDYLDSNFLSWNLIIYGLLELFIVVGLYGPFKFMTNIQEMGMLCGTNTQDLLLQSFWTVCWCFIMPITLVGLLISEVGMALKTPEKRYAHLTNRRLYCTSLCVQL